MGPAANGAASWRCVWVIATAGGDAGHESLMNFTAFIRELLPSGNEVCFSTCLSFIRGAGQLP